MRRLGAVVALAVALLAAGQAVAQPRAYVPPHGRIWHGVSDTGQVGDFRDFARQVRAHPALDMVFYHWDVSLKASGAFTRWRQTRTRGVVTLSNALPASGGPELTPRQIAKGRGDHYLLRLGQSIDTSGQTVYFRLFAEMNGHWNPYCAFNADGTRRPQHSTAAFVAAWRRIVLIVRGGPRARVNRRLVRNGMPRIYRARGERDPVYAANDVPVRLPRPRVAFMWVPQTFGSPNIPGNQPRDYWPGARFVDWVGADIYAKFRTAFDELRAFYHQWDRWPFVIGEYAPWDNDFSGDFTRHLFEWAKRNHRVRALIYYRSVSADNEFSIEHYPGARRVLRHELNSHRFQPFAPGMR